MFVGLSGLVFGCSDKYKNLTVSITTQQARAEDGSITLYVDGPSEEISITMSGAPKDFNYVPAFSFSNPEYISVNPINNVIDKGVKKTITAVAPGTTTMTVTTSEGGKSASLKINVIKKATGINFKEDYTLALVRKTGAEATINYSTALKLSPEDSNQTFIKFGMETNTNDIVIDANTGKLTVINGDTALEEVVVFAKLVDHMGNDEEGIDPTRLTVKLVDEILPEDMVLYKGSTLADILPENIITDTITLAKNIDSLNYINVILEVKTLQSIHIELPVFTTSSPVTAYPTTSQIYTIGNKQYFMFRVNAIRYDLDYVLKFQVELTGFEGQFDYHKDLDLICDLYAKDFEINDVVRTDYHELVLYTNDETNGSRMHVAISNPREISDENGQFTVELYDNDTLVDNQTLIERYFEIKANGPVNILDNTFDNDTTFFIKMVPGALTPADSGRFKLVIKATVPEKESLRATTTVKLLVRQGIQSIDQFTYVQNEETITSGFGDASVVKLNLDAVSYLDFQLVLTPADADTMTLRAKSLDEGIVKVEKIGSIFRLTPLSVGTTTIQVSSTTLEGIKFFKVSVYKPISDFLVGLNSDSNNNVGKLDRINESLTNIVAKQNKTVKLLLTTKPLNAEYNNISYQVTLGGTELTVTDGVITDETFSLNPTTNSFIFLKNTTETYTVTITLTNHDGDEIVREFTTSVYIPIESIYIDTTDMRTELYNPNNLGYFDLTNAEESYTSVNVPVTITPANATYAGQVQYVVRVDGKAENSNILLRNGNIFSVNADYPIESYPKSVFIVAQVQEFDRLVATSQEFIIRDPIPVQSLIVDGVSNDLLYFKQGVDTSKDLKISTLPAKGVFNNKVKWVQLAEDSDTILDFADAPARFDKTNSKFDVVYNKQTNTLTVMPKSVGNARLLIIPEDKITDFKDNKYTYDWDGVVEIFVSVADGSEANPYHISSYQDLKDVSLALDKFYMMTADVNVTDNWEPLALTETTPFMGGINGKYERLNKQHKITGLSYATAGTSPYAYFGLIGANSGKLKNLDITYDFVQTTFSSIHFGGLVGKNLSNGTIENCTVTFNDINISYQYSMWFGGLVGYNQGKIENSQSGISINCTANIATQVSASELYVGGMVGYNSLNTDVVGSLLDIGREDEIEINYGTSGYDVVTNITVALPEGASQSALTNIGIGGVFGAIVGQKDHPEVTTISNLSVQGKITANGFSRVGGFVGFAQYATINNSFSITRVFARENVGGFVGYAEASEIAYSSAENYNSDSLTARDYVVGDNYLGGFAGTLLATQVSFSYVISYYTNNTTYDIKCLSDADTNTYVGGFAANVDDESVINYCASNINISVNNSYCVGAFIGNLGVGNTVDNFYCRGTGTIQGTPVGAKPTGLNSDDEIDPDATYYSTYSIATINPDDPLATLGLRKGNGSYVAADGDPEKFWQTTEGINDGLPYITREDGKVLFANLPLIIDVKFDNNLDGYTPDKLDEVKQDGYIYVDEKTIILFYNNIDDGSLTLSQLIGVNTHNLNTFADVTVNPLTQKTARLNISSSNTNVVKVNKNGTFQVVGEGSAILTVSSQLNYSCLIQINLIVKLGVNDYNLYESSNLTQSSKVSNLETEPVEVLIKTKAPLFSQIEYQRELLSKDLNLQANQEISIRYILGDSNCTENFIINKEWLYDNINNYYYVDIPFNEVASIIAKVKTLTNVKITAIPYLSVTYKDFVGSEGMKSSKVQLDYLAKDFYVSVKNGATNIYFESNSTNMEMTQLQTLVFTVVVETDILDDDIAFVEKLYNEQLGEFEDSDELTINPSASETIYDPTTNEVVAVKVKYSIAYPYDKGLSEEDNLLSEDKEFKINFRSSLKSSINKDLSLTIKPQSIVSVDLGLYSNYSDYLTKDGTDTHIFNGVPALLTIEVYPYFSRFDRLEVCYTTNSGYDITLTQLQFDRNKIENKDGQVVGVEKALSTYPSGEGSGEYITGYGIKLNKTTGADSLISTTDSIYSYSKLYYLSVLIGSEVPDLTEFRLQVKFYNDNEQVRPFDAIYNIKSLSQPTINFDLNNQGLKGNVPIGTNNLLDVTVNNFEGEIDWSVMILDASGQPDEKLMDLDDDETVDYYALRKSLLPTKVGSEYYFKVDQNAIELLGKTVRITATVTKTDNTSAGAFTATKTKDFLITLYTIKSVTVESVSNNLLLLPIYTPYNLRLKVSAYYSDIDYVFDNGSQRLTIRNLLARLENALSKEDVWYYLCNDLCSIEGHPSYHQLEAGNIKYNNIFNFISYNDYFAVYGYEVDQVTTIRAEFAIGYENGLPVVDLPEEGQVSTAVNSSNYQLEFGLMFDYQADIKNPIPIQTAEELYAMEEGKDYRLIADIELDHHKPITTAISSLDGNGYTIYITGFEAYSSTGAETGESAATQVGNIGLFASLQAEKVLSNITVYYLQSVVNNSRLDEYTGEYISDINLPAVINPLEVNASALTSINFGGIVAVNDGIITNCTTTGKLKFDLNNEILTAGYNGGLVGINNGFLTNSKVENFEFTSSGNVGGFVAQNNKIISTCYVTGAKIINKSTDIDTYFTGGFVTENAQNAEIYRCFTQGIQKTSDTTIVHTGGGIQTSGVAGGFVYTNSGNIQDCYSNIAVSASEMSAGFVFTNNNEAVVNNCYSISKIASNSRTASPFTGIGRDGGVIVVYSGVISNCFYLAGDYYQLENEPARKISQDNFSTTATFSTFDIAMEADDADNAEGHTWIVKDGKPVLVNTQIATFSRSDYVGKSKTYSDSYTFAYNTTTKRYEQAGTSNYLQLTRTARSVYYETGGAESEKVFLYPKTEKIRDPYTNIESIITRWYEGDEHTGIITYTLEELEGGGYELVQVGNEANKKTAVVTNYTEVYAEGATTFIWETNQTTYPSLVNTDKNPYQTIERDGAHEYLEVNVIGATYETGIDSITIDLSLDRYNNCDLVFNNNTEDGFGTFTYKVVENIQYYYTNLNVGTKTNPYLIYDLASFNAYLKDANAHTAIVSTRNYYRLVTDIDFAFKTPSTSTRTLWGFLEGNSMTLSNIVLTYESSSTSQQSFGLFGEIKNSIITDLNIQVGEIVSSAHTYVGGLAGRAYAEPVTLPTEEQDDVYKQYTIISNVNVTSVDENSVVLGRNIVGGLIGYATGDVRFTDITVSTNVNSVFVVPTEAGVKFLMYERLTGNGQLTNEKLKLVGLPTTGSSYQDYNNTVNQNISYAGGIIGILDAKLIDPAVNELDYDYHITNSTVQGEVHVAGRVVGGMFGLVATDNLVNDATFVLQANKQSLRGDFMTGGVVGENRGVLTNITLDYSEKDRETIRATGVGLISDTHNQNLFNNGTKTVTIGGIVGFNNQGSITNSISHADVRNLNATVAGGAVGRMVGGKLKNVVVTGSVRAKSIMGGMVGTVNTAAMLLYSNGFVFAAQYDLLPYNSSATYNQIIATNLAGFNAYHADSLPKFEDCVAANNWLISDAAFIVPQQNVYRVAGGFIGVESLRTDYQLDMYMYDIDGKGLKADGVTPTDDGVPEVNQQYIDLASALQAKNRFENCYYTYSAYGTTNPAPASIPSNGYIAPLFITNYDAPYITLDKNVVDKTPSKAIHNIGSTSVTGVGVGTSYGLFGVTHFDMLYNNPVVYNNVEKQNNDRYIVTLPNIGTSLALGNYLNNMLLAYGYKSELQLEEVEGVHNLHICFTLPESVIDVDVAAGSKPFNFVTASTEDGKTLGTLTIGYKAFAYRNFNQDIWDFGENFYANSLAGCTKYPSIKKFSKTYSWEDFIAEDPSKDDQGNPIPVFEGSGTSADPYKISTAEDLAKLAVLVNKGIGSYKNEEKYYKLTKDIDLSSKYWKPIGTKTNPFKGVFDGDSHYINYTTVNSTLAATDYVGVFGYVSHAKAVIKNLNTYGGHIEALYDRSCAGGIVGKLDAGIIENCTNANTVKGAHRVGGVAAEATTIKDCSNYGNISLVSASEYRGPTPGELSREPLLMIGGVVGWASSITTTKNTVNEGTITVDDTITDYINYTATVVVGGFYGLVDNVNNETTGVIHTNLGTINVISSAHQLYVGGFAGISIGNLNIDTTIQSQIINKGILNVRSFNSNDFMGTAYKLTNQPLNPLSETRGSAKFAVGGIVGSNLGYVYKCANNGDITFTTNYLSYAVSGVGGIVGINEAYSTGSKIEQCYNINTITTNISSSVTVCGTGGIVGLSFGTITVGDTNNITAFSGNYEINNSYNMGEIAGGGKGYNFIGGIIGMTAVVKEGDFGFGYNVVENTALQLNYNPGDTGGAESYGNCKINNTYNIGIINYSGDYAFGRGSIAGYSAYIICSNVYYLKGTADYAGYAYDQSDDEASIENILNSTRGVEQKTSNNMKYYYKDAAGTEYGIKLLAPANNAIWVQEVDTWYPTLKLNNSYTMWEDYTQQVESIASNTYGISTAEQLASLSAGVNSGAIKTSGLTFKLLANIDLSNKLFEPIGTIDYPFRGTFDGDGYTIKYMTINNSSAYKDRSGTSFGSLFGFVIDATITNVGLISPTITGVNYAAGFVHSAVNSHISYCYNEIDSLDNADSSAVDNYKYGKISADTQSAGIANTLDNSTITRSYSNTIVHQVQGTGTVAGLVTTMQNSSSITDSYVDDAGVGGNLQIDGTASETFVDIQDRCAYYAYNVDTTSSFARVYNLTNAKNTANNSADTDAKSVYISYAWNEHKMVAGQPQPGFDAVLGNVDPTPTNLDNLGWDMINVWSSEYALNTGTKTNATIRRLGKNWINSECEDLVLTNASGKSILNRADNENEFDFIYYNISSAKELAWVAYNLNNGFIKCKVADGTQIIFRLTQDINLNGKYWTPIGTLDNPFTGVLDFNNHTISNMIIDSENDMYAGLIGYAQGASLRNGYIVDSYIKVDATSQTYEESSALKSMYMGALVAKGHNTSINNIQIEANLSGYSKYNIFTGAVSGSLTYANSSLADPVKLSNIKVLKPDNETKIPAEYRGENQVAGIDEVDEIDVNIGAFSTLGNTYVGGVVGYLKGAYTASNTNSEAYLEYVHNYANIVSYSANFTAYTYGGGIVGYLLENGKINRAQNDGIVKTFTRGYDYTGGVVGMVESSEVTNVYNSQYIECSQFSSALSYAGGLFGYVRSGSIIKYAISTGETNKNIDSTQIVTGGAIGYVLKDVDGSVSKVGYVAYKQADAFETAYNGDAPETTDASDFGMVEIKVDPEGNLIDIEGYLTTIQTNGEGWDIVNSSIKVYTEKTFTITDNGQILIYLYNESTREVTSTSRKEFAMGEKIVLMDARGLSVAGGKNITFKIGYDSIKATGKISASSVFEEYTVEAGSTNNAIIFVVPSYDVSITVEAL